MRSIAFLLVCCCVSAHAENVTYVLDPAHTHVHFEVRHFGTSTSRGRFDDIRGSVVLDRTAGRGEVSIAIGTGSVSSGFAPLDSALRGRDFFASTDFPDAYFVGKQWRWRDGGLPELRGEFTLRGVSQALTLRATGFGCHTHPTLGREVCGGDFEAELSSGEFGITYGQPFVSDRVRLVIQVEGVRQ